MVSPPAGEFTNTTMSKVWLMNINDATDDWLKRLQTATESFTEGVVHEYYLRRRAGRSRKVTKQRQREQINIH